MPVLLLFVLVFGAVALLHDGLALAALSVEDLSVAASGGVSVSTAFRRRRGRPRKFAAPSRAVTLTLPESVIAALSHIHEDLSRAIVALAQRQSHVTSREHAELVVFGNRAIITIRPTPSLERRAGVHLVPLPNGRALISFDTPKTLADLELTLEDSLDDATLSADDRQVYESITAILKDARRSKDVSLLRRNIIVLESAAVPRRPDKGVTKRRPRKE